VSIATRPIGADASRLTLAEAIARVTAGADGHASFPRASFDALRACGATAWGARAGGSRPRAADELGLVRRVAAADGSAGRIFDGHVNAIERVAVHGSGRDRDRALAAARSGELLAGVWGANPAPGEGPPARLARRDSGVVLRGVKVFCSGAGGIDHAIVVAREATGPPRAVWLDVSDPDVVEVDATWFRGVGLRSSVSHRVVFHDAPVSVILGAPGVLTEEPWFSRDALRTAATWAGMADTVVDEAVAMLARRGAPGELEALAVGRIFGYRATIDAWLTRAAAAMDETVPRLASLSVHARQGIAAACRQLVDEVLRICGSRALTLGGRLERAHRDLETLLLQHRLDPLVARLGRQELDARR
jgi:alkylation response protein AidB-like acyl-CoA dehydrogenase